MASTAELLQAYTDAELAILKGQSVKMGERQLTRADLGAVQAERRRLQDVLATEQAAASGRRGGRFAQASFN